MTTDATVYPPPAADSVVTGDYQPKKRRLAADGDSETGVITPTAGLNDVKQARFTNLFLANTHIATVHEIVKRECEDLADLCVGILPNATSALLTSIPFVQDKVKLWVTLTMPK